MAGEVIPSPGAGLGCSRFSSSSSRVGMGVLGVWLDFHGGVFSDSRRQQFTGGMSFSGTKDS